MVDLDLGHWNHIQVEVKIISIVEDFTQVEVETLLTLTEFYAFIPSESRLKERSNFAIILKNKKINMDIFNLISVEMTNLQS